MKKLNHKGFSAVEVILLVVIVGLLGFVGWRVWDAGKTEENQATEQTVQTTEQTEEETQEPTIEYKTYTAKSTGISLDYPEDWTVKEEIQADKKEYTTITSPNGSMVVASFSSQGVGGSCVIKENNSNNIYIHSSQKVDGLMNTYLFELGSKETVKVLGLMSKEKDLNTLFNEDGTPKSGYSDVCILTFKLNVGEATRIGSDIGIGENTKAINKADIPTIKKILLSVRTDQN